MPGRTRVALRHTVLEERAVPAVFVVTNLADSGSGSLRQAVLDANGNAGPDSVEFQPGVTGTLYLTSGAIVITDPVTVTGPGSMTAESLIVMSNSPDRLFYIVAPAHLIGLSLANSSAAAEPFIGYGGAVASQAALNISDCVFTNNGATHGGGAIYQIGPTLALSRCRFTANGTGSGSGRGGAINASGAVAVESCEFWGNTVRNVGSGGGAINLTGGSLTLDSCSFVGNGTPTFQFGYGGAVLAFGPVTARNCTFAGNRARFGGGLQLTAGGTLLNCTVTGNAASPFGSMPGGAGGIYSYYGGVTLESTIVSGNTAWWPTPPDVWGPVTAKSSLLGSTLGVTSYTDQGGNLPVGTNPQFSIYGTDLHGGLVSTTALLATSPCRDAGSNPAGLAYDARGPGFPRAVGAAIDMGAYEIQPPPRVSVLQVNDGSAQRSRVTSISITFDHRDIYWGSGPGWNLQRALDNAPVTLASTGTFTPTSITYKLTFTSGPLDYGSLADGVYVFKVFAADVTDSAGQFLDGNGDGVGGDDYVSPTTGPGRIHRLFGDADGSGSVDVVDFGGFRGAFSNGSNLAFDFDGDGDVDAADFGQFRQRFGSSV